jgi:phosphatidylcholine synthase
MLTGAIPAALVHVLTASGILCSLLAIEEAVAGNGFAAAFAWLGLALLIDAIDGPLARRVGTKKYLPRFSGERLDLIIDYVNYVLVPAFILLKSGMIDGRLSVIAAGAILMSSLFHFSDVESKTDDNYFVGFPAVWNVVVFYLLTFTPASGVSISIVIGLALATFVPLKWVHPLRVQRFRPLTLAVVAAWTLAAILTLLADFNPGWGVRLVLLVGLVYVVGISVQRSMHSMSTS